MKSLYFDVDSPSEIKHLAQTLELLLSIDGIPSPQVVVHNVPDNLGELIIKDILK